MATEAVTAYLGLGSNLGNRQANLDQALEFMSPKFPQHLERIHPDEKADCLVKRLHPLPEDRIIKLPEEVWGRKVIWPK